MNLQVTINRNMFPSIKIHRTFQTYTDKIIRQNALLRKKSLISQFSLIQFTSPYSLQQSLSCQLLQPINFKITIMISTESSWLHHTIILYFQNTELFPKYTKTSPSISFSLGGHSLSCSETVSPYLLGSLKT